jgi:diguanylate cyclase (GGDEF)-like protein/PAS domain S-box-containing protein
LEFSLDSKYQYILEQLYEGVYFVDKSMHIEIWNKSAEKITGYSAEEVKGKRCSDNILRHIDENGKELCLGGCPLGQSLHDGKHREDNVYLHHKDGHRVPVSVRVSPVYDDNGNITGAVELFTDISNQMEMMKELEILKKEVLVDSLTMVGNRKYADMVLAKRMEFWNTQDVSFAVYFVDIDFFKNVNDTYGHNFGDDVLKMVAKSLEAALRPFDAIIRWGGEEFLVVTPNVSAETATEIGERMRMMVEKSWRDVGEEKVGVTVSIGCSCVQSEDTVIKIVDRADKAMYESKQNGRNRVTII